MGRRMNYGNGTFCWVNLSTTDPETAKRFYGELLGWEYDDRPADGFSMARLGDANVAAVYPRDEREHAHGRSSHWNNYISVDDVDHIASRVQEIGGSVLDAPFDVSDAGRTSVLADPSGAVFWVWQARTHIGADRVNDPGCFMWNELSTNDAQRAAAFYSTLFGWQFEQNSAADSTPYWQIRHGPAAMGRNGGLRELSPRELEAGATPRWMPYFTVESMATAAERAKASGGSIVYGPADAGAGIIAVLKGPTGAVFGVFEGAIDD